MYRLAITAASVMAIALGTAAFAQTSTSPSNSSRVPLAPEHKSDCATGGATGGATAKMPSAGVTADRGSSADRAGAGVSGGEVKKGDTTAMTDCDPTKAPEKGTMSPKPGTPGTIR